MSATRTEAVTASEHLGMLNSSLEFVNQKLHNNLTRPCVPVRSTLNMEYDIISFAKSKASLCSILYEKRSNTHENVRLWSS